MGIIARGKDKKQRGKMKKPPSTFFEEFFYFLFFSQPMAFALDYKFLSSNQDTNRFLE